MIAITAIKPRLLQVCHFLGTAVWTANFAIRPANGDHELRAVLVLGEELDCFLECLWRFHVATVAKLQESVTYITPQIRAKDIPLGPALATTMAAAKVIQCS